MDVKSVGLPSEIRTSCGLMWKAPIVCDLPKIIKSKLKKEEEKIKFKTKLYINLPALLTMHPNDNMNDAVIGDGPPKSMSS